MVGKMKVIALLGMVLSISIGGWSDAPAQEAEEVVEQERFIKHSSMGSLEIGTQEIVNLNLFMDKETKCYYIVTENPVSMTPYIVNEKPYCEKDESQG